MLLQVLHDCRPLPLVQGHQALYNVILQKVPRWEEWEPWSTEVYSRNLVLEKYSSATN
jgi:hypothetical protein